MNTIRLAFASLAALLFVSNSAFANDAMDAAFQRAGAKIPLALIAQGKSKIGSLDLRQFVRDMATIQLAADSEANLERRNGDGRKSARWEYTKKGPTIFYDPAWIENKTFKGGVSRLALHEYLNILGYKDKEYENSLGLWFLTQPKAIKILHDDEKAYILKIIASKLFRRSASAGGIIGVGGGGQEITLMYRGDMMLRALDFFSIPGQDRAQVMNALVELWLKPDNVTYKRGARPRVDFSLEQ